MDRKKTIRKILVLAAWFLVICGITSLLIAANRKQKAHLCTEILVGIKGTGEKYYIEKADVLELIEKTANGSLLNRSVTSVNLGKIEKALEANPWISGAELYFDSKDALHVYIEEREPVARVFTTAGNSFYIDSGGFKMPLLEKLSLRLPVVTGFTNAKKWNSRDSALMNDVKTVVGFVYSHPFWNAQIGQIDITNEGTFELIPVIGGHIIRLGDAEGVEDKLNRLYVFYKQVMSKVGFNKYAALDVRYAGQVVAVNKGATSVVDSIQLRKNIEELMNRATLQNIDEEMLPSQNITLTQKDSTVSNTAAQTNSVSTKTNPNPTILSQTNSNPARTKAKQDEKKPKAVMKRG
jgi:cell division protein FtsQ